MFSTQRAIAPPAAPLYGRRLGIEDPSLGLGRPCCVDPNRVVLLRYRAVNVGVLQLSGRCFCAAIALSLLITATHATKACSKARARLSPSRLRACRRPPTLLGDLAAHAASVHTPSFTLVAKLLAGFTRTQTTHYCGGAYYSIAGTLQLSARAITRFSA